MMAKSPKNPDAAKELLRYIGSAEAQQVYLSVDSSVIGASQNIPETQYNALQAKSRAAVAEATYVTQFLDRDTSPEFASNVAGQAFADFIADPSSVDGILEDMQAQAEVIFEQ